MNSVEKRAAIETGQEADRQDIHLNAHANDRAEVLRKTFTEQELENMRKRMLATQRGERIEAPEIKGFIEEPKPKPEAPKPVDDWRD